MHETVIAELFDREMPNIPNLIIILFIYILNKDRRKKERRKIMVIYRLHLVTVNDVVRLWNVRTCDN